MAISTDAGSSTRTVAAYQQVLLERTDRVLLEIIRNNFNTQYATQAPSLSAFCNAISAHGSGTEVDATLLADFRTHVPLSNYDCYRPFVDRFNGQPCRKEDVENLFAPGLPNFFAISSSTSGAAPKLLARYANVGAALPRPSFIDPESKNTLAAIAYCGYVDVKKVEGAPGQVVARIPVCLATGRLLRRVFGLKFSDEKWISITTPRYGVPWAVTTIVHLSSFLTIHGLFFLTHRDVDRFYAPFATLFVDLIYYIDKRWDMLVSCIRYGVLPDLEGIEHVRGHLQAQFHADPERAAELLEIGPPSSVEGWALRVWPEVKELCAVCTGPWNMMLSKVRSILGPNTFIRTPGYGSTESSIGISYDVNRPEEFVLSFDSVIEFLDFVQGETHENIRQAWEVEVGKQYEPILTTRHGLWRYQVGDIVTIIGFHPERYSPIFKYLGRRSVKIYLPHTGIAEFHLIEALSAINSEDMVVVQEFTTMVDDRSLAPTVGYFVELSKPPGPNAHLAPRKLFDALATDAKHRRALEDGIIRLPTIRILKPGTFAEFRCWRGQVLKRNSGQIKVPIVLVDPTMKEWVLERVDREL